jgi:hypothetical protein
MEPGHIFASTVIIRSQKILMARDALWPVSSNAPLSLQLEHDLTPSAAIASNIANGFDIDRAVKAACRYVDAGIRTAKDIGAGNGPINHFHSVYILPFAPYVRPLQELHGFSRSIGVILSSTFLTDPMLREHGKSIRSIAFWNVLPMAHSLWNHLRTI